MLEQIASKFRCRDESESGWRGRAWWGTRLVRAVLTDRGRANISNAATLMSLGAVSALGGADVCALGLAPALVCLRCSRWGACAGRSREGNQRRPAASFCWAPRLRTLPALRARVRFSRSCRQQNYACCSHFFPDHSSTDRRFGPDAKRFRRPRSPRWWSVFVGRYCRRLLDARHTAHRVHRRNPAAVPA